MGSPYQRKKHEIEEGRQRQREINIRNFHLANRYTDELLDRLKPFSAEWADDGFRVVAERRTQQQFINGHGSEHWVRLKTLYADKRPRYGGDRTWSTVRIGVTDDDPPAPVYDRPAPGEGHGPPLTIEKVIENFVWSAATNASLARQFKDAYEQEHARKRIRTSLTLVFWIAALSALFLFLR